MLASLKTGWGKYDSIEEKLRIVMKSVESYLTLQNLFIIVFVRLWSLYVFHYHFTW